MSLVFEINGVDMSSNVIAENYKVNQADVYDSYIDANGHEHRNIYRTKVSGTFDMRFRSLNSYMNFLKHLSNSKTVNGYFPCKIAVNNTGEIVERYLYISFNTTRQRNSFRRDDYGVINISVEEY